MHTPDPFADPFAPTAPVAQTAPRVDGRAVSPKPRAGRIPGEMGIWVFVFIDMWFFTGLMGVTVYTHGQDPAVFEAGRESLTLWEGTFNTLLLLTASYFVVLAMRAVKAENPDRARRLLVVAMLCALGFVINKAVEYQHLFADGHDPGSSDFYTFFFILTGFHLLHMLVGTAGLAYMRRVIRRPAIDARAHRNLEVSATYWHLVDLLWVVIFAVLYLLR
jgi:nitric oxide reductase NorE protein